MSSTPSDSETPSSSSSSTPSPSKRIVYHVETTGSLWGDVQEAFKVHALFICPPEVLQLTGLRLIYYLSKEEVIPAQ